MRNLQLASQRQGLGSVLAFVILSVGLGTSCSSTPKSVEAKSGSGATLTTSKKITQPFPFKNLKDDQQMALKAYLKGEACPSQRAFGSVAKALHFTVPTLDEIEESMKANDCKKKIDVLKGLDNQPYLTRRGNTIPLWVWLCEDGTVVRVKPKGDPTSKYNRNAHGSVALRYPCDAPYNSFEDEMMKVDNNGNPIPKWSRELDSKDPEVIESWAHSAHFSVIVTRAIK
jgi:hypothetical protein